LSEPTVAAACVKSNIPRRTIENWLRDNLEFRKAFSDARERTFGLALGRLAKAANEAVTCLVDGMQGQNVSHVQRLCARDILTFAAQARTEDVRTLADEIKEMLQEAGKDDG